MDIAPSPRSTSALPRWSEDPRHILGVLANYLRLEDVTLAPDAQFARRRTEADAMIETLAARAGRRSRLRARIVRFALRRAHALLGLRELPKYYLIVAFAAVRRQLAMVGAELAASGRLERRDDVFFVDLLEGPRRPRRPRPAAARRAAARSLRPGSCAAGISRG
jgi:pyruvate,water dikinase